jgi:hypothetical protein
MALRVASMDAPVRIVADCAYVVEGLQHLIEHGTPSGSKHTTLWRSTADVIVARRAPTEVCTVRSRRTSVELYAETL